MITYELNANSSVSIYNNRILVAIYKTSVSDLIRDLRYSLTGRIPAELIDIVINNAVSIKEAGFVPELVRVVTC